MEGPERLGEAEIGSGRFFARFSPKLHAPRPKGYPE